MAIRRYQLVPDADIDDLVQRIESGFVPIVSQVPGFVHYSVIFTDDGFTASVSGFQNEAGAAESTNRAKDWVNQNIASFFQGPPEVTAGAVRVQVAGASGLPATPAS